MIGFKWPKIEAIGQEAAFSSCPAAWADIEIVIYVLDLCGQFHVRNDSRRARPPKRLGTATRTQGIATMPQAVSEGARVNQGVIRLIKGDITDLAVDAFVFYAEPTLALGSGFGGAIAVRGGPAVQKELASLGPLTMGQAVIASAGKLKARHIIHAGGPSFREEETEAKLRTTVASVLKLAEENRIERLALPAMGAGYYGVAPELCARVMMELVRGHLSGRTAIRDVTFCVLDTRQYESFRAALSASNRQPGSSIMSDLPHFSEPSMQEPALAFMGLFIADRIARAHGGHIELESEPAPARASS